MTGPGADNILFNFDDRRYLFYYSAVFTVIVIIHSNDVRSLAVSLESYQFAFVWDIFLFNSVVSSLCVARRAYLYAYSFYIASHILLLVLSLTIFFVFVFFFFVCLSLDIVCLPHIPHIIVQMFDIP